MNTKKLSTSKKSSKKLKTPKSAVLKGGANTRNRRAKRYKVTGLWVNEFQGDFQFLLPVENISEGGIFVRGRTRGDGSPSRLILRLGKNTLELEAQGVHDTLVKDSVGTGYCFVNQTENQTLVLKNFLRNLN